MNPKTLEARLKASGSYRRANLEGKRILLLQWRRWYIRRIVLANSLDDFVENHKNEIIKIIEKL